MAYESVISRAHPGCLLLMLDQSASMAEPWGNDGFTKAQVLADTVNELLKTAVVRCTTGTSVRDYFEVGVLGYGNNEVNDLLSGQKHRLDLQPMRKVADEPARLEDRIQVLEDRNGAMQQVPYKMPIWIDVKAFGNTPMVEAFTTVIETAEEWVDGHPDSYPPVIINITDAAATDGDPTDIAASLRGLATRDGNALLFNIHISESAERVVLFPQHDAQLRSDEYARLLYEMSSTLPAAMVRAASDVGLDVGSSSRAFAHNADPANLIEVLDIGTTPLLGVHGFTSGQ